MEHGLAGALPPMRRLHRHHSRTDLATLQNLIRTGFVATFLQSRTTTDPRLTWIARHCLNVTRQASARHAILPLAVYVCLAGT